MRRALVAVLPALCLAGASGALMGWIYQVDPSVCPGCGNCISWCPEGAISLSGGDAWIDPDLCNACGICVQHCPYGAIYRTWWESAEGSPPPPSISVEPNPAADFVTVTGLRDGETASVVDLLGREVGRSPAGAGGVARLDLSGLAKGVYLVMAGGAPAGSVILLGR